MCNRLKIKFLGAQRPQEVTIINVIMDISPVSIRNIFMARSHAILIFNKAEDIDKLHTNEANNKLAAKELKAITSSDNNHERTVFVTKLRPFVANYTPEELSSNINKSNAVTVKQLFIVKRHIYANGQPVSLKLTFSTLEEIRTVLEYGTQILKMDIPPERIYMEDPINIVQYFKCFMYGHPTHNCKAKDTICSKCASTHHFRA